MQSRSVISVVSLCFLFCCFCPNFRYSVLVGLSRRFIGVFPASHSGNPSTCFQPEAYHFFSLSSATPSIHSS
ncbi:hypothetical protein L1987_79130 [Smallanthus sonchifolius]|uniref:Uncharacterized protein n=1 Tax=Smallanthus sonchifolius TaxID=185202 RepID=A0ACB8ZF62_9ASTR|nr:hypothetical protein L1987_79130 [Smallanthus sonchifolius]